MFAKPELGDNDSQMEGRYIRLEIPEKIPATLWSIEIFGFNCEN